MLTANELRNGTVYKHENKTWIVLNYEFTKTGRGSGTVKVKSKDIINGAIVEKGFNLNQKFEEGEIEKKTSQFLYRNEDELFFMDSQSYDQFSIPAENSNNLEDFILEGEKVIAVFLDETPISIELPKTVNLKVVYAEDSVKGDTSNNPTKMVELETGLKIQAPMFIKQGEIIKVKTEDKSYSERVNK